MNTNPSLSHFEAEDITSFFNCTSKQDLASVLREPYRRFTYLLFAKDPSSQYATYSISKNYKQERRIEAPITPLKNIQRKLYEILKLIYKPPFPVHAFVENKSIVTNAIPHLKAYAILKLDIKDFFPSINFGRVRGLFLSTPFSFNHDVATTIARICCKDNHLPQGAPTSPIIANMICLKLDKQLMRIAKNNRCNYTRYADDLTFSTNNKTLFSFDVESLSKMSFFKYITESIERNGFSLNNSKSRLMCGRESKFISGIKVNTKLNTKRTHVRTVRGMLHALEKFGPENCINIHNEKRRRRKTLTRPTNFINVLRGKISFLRMVKGADDICVLRLENRLNEWLNIHSLYNINCTQVERLINLDPSYHAIIYSEGKTDRILLQYALTRLRKLSLFKNLKLYFYSYPDTTTTGESFLKKLNDAALLTNPPRKLKITLFDRDIKDTQGLYHGSPKHWGNNVWSLMIPCPPFRKNIENEISIEHYFNDKIIFQPDSYGRHLYFASDFDLETKLHKKIDGVRYTNKKKLGDKKPHTIIDSDVVNSNGDSIALSKNNFAKNIASGIFKTSDEDILAFNPLFEAIEILANKFSH